MTRDDAAEALALIDDLWPEHAWTDELKRAVGAKLLALRIDAEQAGAALRELRLTDTRNARSPAPAAVLKRLRELTPAPVATAPQDGASGSPYVRMLKARFRMPREWSDLDALSAYHAFARRERLCQLTADDPRRAYVEAVLIGDAVRDFQQHGATGEQTAEWLRRHFHLTPDDPAVRTCLDSDARARTDAGRSDRHAISA